MIKFFLGVLIGIGLVVLASYLFVARGGIFMGTDTKPLPLERATAGAAINALIGKNADDPSPLPADEITGFGPGFASATAAEVTFRRARTQRKVVETANAERPTSNVQRRSRSRLKQLLTKDSVPPKDGLAVASRPFSQPSIWELEAQCQLHGDDP